MTPDSSTLIDVIMTSSNNIVEDSGVVVSHFSDHFLVYTSLKLKLPKSPSGSVNLRSYKNYDRHKFVEDLEVFKFHDMRPPLLTTQVKCLITSTQIFSMCLRVTPQLKQ